MLRSKQRDFYGNEFWGGELNGQAIIMDRVTDERGDSFWQGEQNGKAYIAHPLTRWTGEDSVEVRIGLRGAPRPQRPAPGGQASFRGADWFALLLIAAVSAFIFYIVWKSILKSDAVEVPIIAIVSSAIGAFFGFRSARALQDEGVAPFMAGLSTCWLISGALFFVISLVCTLLPTSAEMYARFSLGTLLGIALISALMSGLPAVLTGLLCQAATWLKRR